MSKIKTTFILALLLTTVFAAFFPLAVKASTGYILIETTTAPSSPVTVPAGGTVNLYFGGVTFSGGQFYLVWSADGFSQISSGDFKYTPTFKVSDLFGPGTTVDSYSIGNGWVNGSIPKDIAGGEYYVKAFDGSATSVAVTDNVIIVTAAFEVVPSWGPGGRAISLKGYAFTANNYVNLSYWDPVAGEEKVIKNLYPTNEKGQFVYNMDAPDLKVVVDPEMQLIEDFIETITFYALDNKTTTSYAFDWEEYPRGLLQVDDVMADEGYIFGNETDFYMWGVEVGVGDELIVAGNYFYPGNVTIWFDGSKYLGSVLANGTGFFNTTVTIPITSMESHYILLKDANNFRFVFYIYVVPTLVLEPKEGPVGTVVTAKAYGFPEKIAVFIYWLEIELGDGTYYWMANATTGADGQFNVTVKFTVPHTYGGAHEVWAIDEYLGEETTDIYGTEIAERDFKVLPTLKIVPDTFANDGSLVTVYGTGLDPTVGYTPNIDNRLLGVDPQNWDYPSSVYCNSTGDLELKFVAAGFTPGLHVFSLYAGGELEPTFLLFTVTGVSPDTQAILDQLAANQADLVSRLTDLSNKIATLANSVDSVKSTLTSGVQNIRSDIAGVKSDLATLSDSMSKGFSGVNSALGTLSSSVDSMGKSLSSQITSLGNTLSKSISDNANSIQTSIKNAQDAVSSQVKSSVGDLSTFLIIIGILAAITLVIEAAILIRRLS
ncbi:MAG: apolipoprotein A1/A4/E family protein [Nitrososphaeria archaeon]|nr:apolipoprotein A1/A4/E family protein [Nitrososphaeria archaeon]